VTITSQKRRKPLQRWRSADELIDYAVAVAQENLERHGPLDVHDAVSLILGRFSDPRRIRDELSEHLTEAERQELKAYFLDILVPHIHPRHVRALQRQLQGSVKGVAIRRLRAAHREKVVLEAENRLASQGVNSRSMAAKVEKELALTGITMSAKQVRLILKRVQRT
jgi:hypothetical protein